MLITDNFNRNLSSYEERTGIKKKFLLLCGKYFDFYPQHGITTYFKTPDTVECNVNLDLP
jgi:uncharacterized Fe-S cluster-containing radical SAM superfamily enzyme